MRLRRRLVILMVCAMWGCGGEGSDRPEDAASVDSDSGVVPRSGAARAELPAAIRAEVAAALARGNAAFERDDLEGAIAAYRAAVRADSLSGAAWFGVWMVHEARGDSSAARRVRARLEAWAAPFTGDPHETRSPEDTAGEGEPQGSG